MPTPRSKNASGVRLRTAMMAVAVAGVWIWALTLPGVGAIVLLASLGVGGALALLGSAMGLGWLGFHLLDGAHRFVAYVTRPPEWFHPDPDEGAPQ